MRRWLRVILVCAPLLAAGCGRLVLPSVTLAGRAGLDLSQRRHARWTARVAFDFALSRSSSATARAASAFDSFDSRDRVLPAPCAGDVLCRYLRRAQVHALMEARREVP